MQPNPTETRRFYVLKVKGKAKIPDYIQVRDDSFTLVGYFRPGRASKTGRMTDPNYALFQLLEQKAENVPFGTVTPLDVTPEELARAQAEE